jgi:hypothetical protein
LFATELKKYDVLVADIKRNTEAQNELLARVAKQNKASLRVACFIACISFHVLVSYVIYVSMGN